VARRRYKVIGSQPILGHAPGETFAANLPDDQEAFLKRIGGLQDAPKAKANPDKASERLADEQEQEKRTES
jgi:hypothetical protein